MATTEYGFENGVDADPLTPQLIDGALGGANHGHFSTSGAMHGNLGCVWKPSENYYWAGWDLGGVNQVAVRFYFNISADVDASNATLAQLNSTSGSGKMASIGWHDDGGITALDSTGTPIDGPSWIAGAITPGTWYRAELVADLTAGSGTFTVYEGDSTTPIGTKTAASGLNYGTGTFTQFAVGVPSTSNWTTGNIYNDSIAYNPGGTAQIGPYVPPVNEDGAYLYTSGQWVRVTVAS